MLDSSAYTNRIIIRMPEKKIESPAEKKIPIDHKTTDNNSTLNERIQALKEEIEKDEAVVEGKKKKLKEMEDQLSLQETKFGPLLDPFIQTDPKQLFEFISYAKSKIKTIDLTLENEIVL